MLALIRYTTKQAQLNSQKDNKYPTNIAIIYSWVSPGLNSKATPLIFFG